ncbi:TPM domain-containing protein [Oleidesulfovibrio sp.]|uniref:TPM domain-containing protein n=1 Tax=Oleidesulfovibrio sp. TaxID=2909707 RepID=UPI003A8AC100
MFFRARGAMRGPLVTGSSPKEKLLRALLLLGVFGLAGWGFWMNSETALETLQTRGAVWDEAGVLHEEETDGLRSMATRFNSEYGIKVRIHVVKSEVTLPQVDSRTLYIIISPPHKQALVEFPPLVRKALGDDFMYSLQNTHFIPYFENGQWGLAVADALKLIWGGLSAK